MTASGSLNIFIFGTLTISRTPNSMDRRASEMSVLKMAFVLALQATGTAKAKLTLAISSHQGHIGVWQLPGTDSV